MRSVFPALHDRYLAALLGGAVLLLVAAIVAISLSNRGDDEKDVAQERRALGRTIGMTN